jgi:hypothetical protein
MRRRLLLLLVTVFATFVQRDVQARVSRIEIVQREPFADGMHFGDVCPYELIRGRLHFTVDQTILAISQSSICRWPSRADFATTSRQSSTVTW